MMPSFAGRNHLCRVLAPAAGTGALAVVGFQIPVHGIHQILQGGEVAPLQATPCQFGEETLHRMHPGTGGGDEVKVPVGVCFQPGMQRGGLMRSVVVQDHVYGDIGGAVGGQLIQKGQKLLLAMPGLRLGGDLSGLHVQGGAGRGGAMSDVGVRVRGGVSRLQGQASLGVRPGLNLGLCVSGQHQGVRGGSIYRPITSRALRAKWGSVESLNCRQRCGASPATHACRRWPSSGVT